MSAISTFYMIMFLPLVACVLCQIFNQRHISFTIALASCISLFLLSGRSLFDALTYQTLANDFNLSHISLAFEFDINSVSLTFLCLTLFIKSINVFYYRQDILALLCTHNHQNFSSVFLLNIFALIGIFSSHNLMNLFIFLEIYAFTFFAISAIANNVDIAKSSFTYFCYNVASSLIILFCFLVIYLILGDLRFDHIQQDLHLIENKTFLHILLFVLFGAFLFKFIPFIFYVKNIKSCENFSNFFITDSLLIKVNIAIFLFLKFSYFIFGNVAFLPILNIDALSIILAFALALYASYHIYHTNNLRLIAIYFCLSNIAFIIACIALETVQSMQALFFYLCNLCLVNFAILLFASVLQKNFHDANIKHLAKIKDQLLVILPFKLLLFFILAFPLTILFFANWYLGYAALEPSLALILLLALGASNFSQVSFIAKILTIFCHTTEQQDDIETYTLTTTQTITSWLLVIVLYASIFALAAMGKLSLHFAATMVG